MEMQVLGVKDVPGHQSAAEDRGEVEEKPVGLFIALNYWNDWYNAMLFLDEGRRDLYPLQYFLNNILTHKIAVSLPGGDPGAAAAPVSNLKFFLVLFLSRKRITPSPRRW